jgi:NADH:ubiquinone oxidoreductase subunit C
MKAVVSMEEVLDALREVVRTHAGPGDSRALAVRSGLIDEVWVTLPARCIRPAVQALTHELQIWHLSTITASDLSAPGEEEQPAEAGIELIYHFWHERGLSLRCALPAENARLPSVSDLIPGAVFYEREVAEMLGVTFDGHPDPSLLLLPDDWEGGAPLRQDYAMGQDL